ncbi:MAG: toprim domain-containing protein [Hyphomonadaceae bacterium]|nr:toprim domain-containing protein [Hyphomonadaceae bacterium]
MSRLERIVAACGGMLLDNGRRALIPGFGHSPKDRSVSLVETEEGRILIHCFSPKDDWRAVRRALAARGLLDRQGDQDSETAGWTRAPLQVQPAEEDRLARARRIWEESRAVHRTLATAYLRRRAIPDTLWRTSALRFHPRMTSLDDRLRRPALVAAIADATGALQGVQVTLLSAYGAAKAPVPTPRRVIGKLMGGAVRLSEAEDTLAVGEGVETMLSVCEALQLPAWAALTADNLAAFSAPPHVRRLVIAHDGDAAGLRAATLLESRHADRISVERAAPPEDFNDWNAWRRRLYD